MEQETYIEFEEVKNRIKDLEMLAHDKMITKVNELNSIIDHIEGNWRGANSVKYRKDVNDINESIEEFRKRSLAPIVENIEKQINVYQNNEDGE